MAPTGPGAGPSAAPWPTPSATQLTTWGLDPSWSRRVTFDGSDGRPVDWHVLDTGPGPAGTVVCVHGNPSWGYIWKDLLTTLSPEWRVIAVDQTGMGWSERGRPRRLADRVAELVSFCRQEVDGPLVLAAHDWGGPVAVGASGSLDVEALILANTAVAKPDDVAVPPLIAAARSLVDLSCRRTPAFVAGTARMTDRRPPERLARPLHRRSTPRGGPRLRGRHPGRPRRPVLRRVAEVCGRARRTPSSDPAAVGRTRPGVPRPFPRRPAGTHTPRRRRAVSRGRPSGHPGCSRRSGRGPVAGRGSPPRPGRRHRQPARPTDGAPFTSILASVAARADDDSAGLRRPRRHPLLGGPRPALVGRRPVPPGCRAPPRRPRLGPGAAELRSAGGGRRHLEGRWRSGGGRRLGRHPPAPPTGPGRRPPIRGRNEIDPGRGHRPALHPRRHPDRGRIRTPRPPCPGASTSNRPVADGGPHTPVALGPDDVAAIVHTSGATGPAKAVRYTHGALAAQRDVVAPLFGMRPGDAFTTSFGPFMLLAPSLQMTCVRPDFPVDKPSALGFDELRAATSKAHVSVAWLSPASARRIVATARGRSVPIGLVMLAGAPIPPDMVAGVRAVTGGDVRTPYGMTECLPVTDGTEPEAVGPLGGNSTGRPVPGCSVVVTPLDVPETRLTDGAWGELLIHAPWMFDGYDAGVVGRRRHLGHPRRPALPPHGGRRLPPRRPGLPSGPQAPCPRHGRRPRGQRGPRGAGAGLPRAPGGSRRYRAGRKPGGVHRGRGPR